MFIMPDSTPIGGLEEHARCIFAVISAKLNISKFAKKKNLYTVIRINFL